MSHHQPARPRPAGRTIVALLVVGLLLSAADARAEDASKFVNKPDEWFTTDEGKQVVSNILSWQHDTGGWSKAYDATKPRPASAAKKATSGEQHDWDSRSTIDNKATYSELRVLARAYRVAKNEQYRKAFDRGLSALIDAQYDNGGWPQRFPPPDDYGRYITYNDEGMVEVMRLMRDVAKGTADFAWTDEATRTRAKAAFDKGVDCILATQIVIDGQPTVWCAQHHEKTLEPAKARAYELPSLSGGESAAITMLLMEIENPDDRVRRAVRGAVRWYEQSKITGIREERVKDESLPRGYDVKVVQDPSAPPLWGRFYDLETGKPFFCGRDGVKKSSLAEIEGERRAGYAWLRPWGEKVLKAYPKWAAKHGVEAAATAS